MFCNPLSDLALLSEKYNEKASSFTVLNPQNHHQINFPTTSTSFNHSTNNNNSQPFQHLHNHQEVTTGHISSLYQPTTTTSSSNSNSGNTANSATTDVSLSPSSFPEILYSSTESSTTNKLIDHNQSLDTTRADQITPDEITKRVCLEQIFNIFTRPTRPLATSILLCEFCKTPVNAQNEIYLVVGTSFYHSHCLQCSVCQINLQWEESCFYHGENIYCRKHYQLISSCSHCHVKFCETDMVLRLPNHTTFHSNCFKCTICDEQLQQGNKFSMHNNAIYCSIHSDLYIDDSLSQTRQSSFLNVDENPLIVKPIAKKSDKNLTSTPADSETLKTNTVVRRKKTKTKKTQKPSTEAKIIWPAILNETAEIENLVVDSFSNNNNCNKVVITQETDINDSRQNLNGEFSFHEGDEQDQICFNIDSSDGYYMHEDSIKGSLDNLSNSDGNEDNFSNTREDNNSSSGRRKRIRTSFKHNQLRIMKSYFELNHNPDAKDLKQLSQRTGLPKRVLQVWFQNARAKYRRSINGTNGCGTSVNIDGDVMPQISPNSFNENNSLKGCADMLSPLDEEHSNNNLSIVTADDDKYDLVY